MVVTRTKTDGRPSPTPEEQAYQTAVEAYGPLPATDPRLMARQIAALQADVAELARPSRP